MKESRKSSYAKYRQKVCAKNAMWGARARFPFGVDFGVGGGRCFWFNPKAFFAFFADTRRSLRNGF